MKKIQINCQKYWYDYTKNLCQQAIKPLQEKKTYNSIHCIEVIQKLFNISIEDNNNSKYNYNSNTITHRCVYALIRYITYCALSENKNQIVEFYKQIKYLRSTYTQDSQIITTSNNNTSQITKSTLKLAEYPVSKRIQLSDIAQDPYNDAIYKSYIYDDETTLEEHLFKDDESNS